MWGLYIERCEAWLVKKNWLRTTAVQKREGCGSGCRFVFGSRRRIKCSAVEGVVEIVRCGWFATVHATWFLRHIYFLRGGCRVVVCIYHSVRSSACLTMEIGVAETESACHLLFLASKSASSHVRRYRREHVRTAVVKCRLNFEVYTAVGVQY